MYFLRRRHGRKPPPESRRETPQAQAPDPYDRPALEDEPITPARPKVITKTRRQRIDSPRDEDSKPAGTFRAGTLHLDRRAQSDARHGKL